MGGPSAQEETVADWGERRLVAEVSRLTEGDPRHEVGIGDDAAVLTVPDGHSVVVSTDRVPTDLLAMRLGLMSPRDLGRYIVEVNVSDVCAMGAAPLGFLLNLALPADYRVSSFRELIVGAATRAAELGAPLVGGDTKTSSEPQFVGTALGTLPAGSAVTRRGATSGDVLAVTGPVGGFGAALAYFLRSDRARVLPADIEDDLKETLLRPQARTDLAPLIRESCLACIDITDGLGESVHELSRASGCDFAIESSLVPLHPAASRVGDLLGIDPLELAFGIGLDLEMLHCPRDSGLPGATVIGEAKPVGPGNQLLVNAKPRALPGKGFEHFRADPAAFVAGADPGQHP